MSKKNVKNVDVVSTDNDKKEVTSSTEVETIPLTEGESNYIKHDEDVLNNLQPITDKLKPITDKMNEVNNISKIIRNTTIMFVFVIAILGVTCFAALILNAKLDHKYTEILGRLSESASETDAKMDELYRRIDTVDKKIESNVVDYVQIETDIENLTNSFKQYKHQLTDKFKELEEEIKEVREAKETKKTKSTNKLSAEAIGVSYNSVPNGGGKLTPSSGIFWYGNQLETYYNLDMSVIVDVAHSNGVSGDYWVRDDGCKMLGDYIMLACNRDVHPYGTLVETSLGTGISLDTGGFAASNPYQVDIAVAW